MKNSTIYLDYNSTTPVDPIVLDSMMPFFKDNFGNPSSQGHAWGWTAEKAVSNARTSVSNLIKCDPKEITFTSGATESNNWAIMGLYHSHLRKNPGEKFHLITTEAEHNSVLNTSKYLAQLGATVDILPVLKDGSITVEAIKSLLKPNTNLVSVMWVNNEIGSLNPIQEIGELCRNSKVYFHSDATQAVGKINVDLTKMPIDLMSFSGHKIYGPKGIGALYKRRNSPFVEIDPLFLGGGQENGERSGTLNVPGIVGLGTACEILIDSQDKEMEKSRYFLKSLLAGLKDIYPDLVLNGPQNIEHRSPINLSISFPEKCGTEISFRLKGIGVSTGSACSTGKISSSHVLKAIGLAPEVSARTLRLSVGRYTTDDSIKATIEAFKALV